MKIISNRNNTNIKVSHTNSRKEFFTGTIPNLGIGHKGKNCIDSFLIFVYRHNLMIQFV